ncbi:MAG TPA: caspase family protein [Pyrinomonadaceae bacterium]|jgi:hypothetical protein
METKRSTFALPFILFCLIITYVQRVDSAFIADSKNKFSGFADKRRALLVGIGKYVPDGNTKCSASEIDISIASRQIPGRGELTDLCGPQNDVREMKKLLIARYGFKDEEIKILLDADATRSNIIGSFKTQIIDAPTGSLGFFFFSGHGSQRKNTLSYSQDEKNGRDERDGKDETIVPADVIRGAKDIRDNELAQLYHQAIDKGIELVVVSDSCHSGTNARGAVPPAYQKNIKSDNTDFKDEICPAGRDLSACLSEENVKKDLCPFPDSANQSVCLSPADRGALILSAAQEYEPAETKLFGGVWHGAFTNALLIALKRSDTEHASAADLLYLIRNHIKSDALRQIPDIEGTTERKNKTLFNAPAKPFAALPALAVENIDGGKVILAAGLAYGLDEGSELYSLKNKDIRIVIEKAQDLTKSIAVVKAPGNVAAIKKGDLFVQDRWAVSSATRINVWLPPSNLTYDQIKRVTAELLQVRSSPQIKWITEPATGYFSHTFYYDGQSWKLSIKNEREIDLGNQPTAGKILENLQPGENPASFFAVIPPARELREQILTSVSPKSAIKIVENKSEPVHYILWGRLTAAAATAAAAAAVQTPSVEYAWILKDAADKLESGVEASAAGGGQTPPSNLSGANSSNRLLPPITDWKKINDGDNLLFAQAANELNDLAFRLGKIRGIATLPDKVSKYTVDKSWFPFQFVIREKATKKVLAEGEKFYAGTIYEAVLIPDKEIFMNVLPRGVAQKRRVYLYAIDTTGFSGLFNNLERQENLIEYSGGGIPGEIILKGRICKAADSREIGCVTGQKMDIHPSQPFGNDVFLLVVTATPLPRPYALQLDGVQTIKSGEVELKGGDTALNQLLLDLTNRNVDFKGAIDNEWWAQRLVLHSMKK